MSATDSTLDLAKGESVRLAGRPPVIAAYELDLAAVVLVLFMVQLSGEWRLNPQYYYGWGVPFLGILLAFRRWRSGGTLRPEMADLDGGSRNLLPLLIAAAVQWLPLRIIWEANMDWRLVEWLFEFGVTGLLLGCAWSFGGRAFAGNFVFPICFLMLAVPWPTRLEHWLVQGLAGAVVKLAGEALRWMGIAAWSAGNLIHLPNTVVGVEDACSGVRALQGSLMCAVFFGEFGRLRKLRRGLLVVAGLLAALLLNFGRNLLLAWTAASNGTVAAERWHDSAGIGTLLACFAVTAIAAWLLRERAEDPVSSDVPRMLGNLSLVSLIACVSWLVLVEASARLWFGLHEKGSSQIAFCDLALDSLSAEEQRIPAATQSILRYDSGSLHMSDAADGSHWWIYRLNWKAGSVGTPLARYHSPEVCLPAGGIQLAEKRPDLHAGARGTARFEAAEYRWLGKPVYVFTNYESTQGKRLIRRFEEFDLTWTKRLLAAAKGIRPGAQQGIEVVLSGPQSEEIAEARYLEFARKAVRD